MSMLHFKLMFNLFRSGETLGPYTIAQMRELEWSGRLLTSDLVAYDGCKQWRDVPTVKLILRHLQNDDTIVYADDEVILTERDVIAKGRCFSLHDIEDIKVILPPESKSDPKTDFVRIGLWVVAVLFFWTLVVPWAVWYTNRKDEKEEGLGAVHGIRLRGTFGEALIKDGLGCLPLDHPKVTEIYQFHRVLMSTMQHLSDQAVLA